MLIIATMMLITRSVMRIRGREGHCEVIRSLGAIVQGKGRKYVGVSSRDQIVVEAMIDDGDV
ncbi:MAG: hypothetical protein CL912_29965 [Deltaproteobacteria bacterium]|nr:hypothetical protein [Deltaproteobacteria bacterium]MAD87206.1 hypothetical protein [Deltaproteobacteria bacterium]